MRWNKLKDYQCPKCSADLFKVLDSETHKCSKCDFNIGDFRLKELMVTLTQKRKRFDVADDDDTRLSELNNLGRNNQSDDFSGERL